MDTEAVKERLNMHLKRKLVTIQPADYTAQHQPPPAPQVPDSVIVPNTAYVAAAVGSTPTTPTQSTRPQRAGSSNSRSGSARSSPRKVRLNRRTLHSSTESISSNQSTPVGHRSAAATPHHHPQHAFVLNNNTDDCIENVADNRRFSTQQQQQQPELLLTSVLTVKKLSIMRDPTVVAFLEGFAGHLHQPAQSVAGGD